MLYIAVLVSKARDDLQVRIPLAELPGVLRQLTEDEADWSSISAKYPAQSNETNA